MPNWVNNTITMEGKDIKSLFTKKGLLNEAEDFDYDKLIPIPTGLIDTVAGGVIAECVALYILKKTTKKHLFEVLEEEHWLPLYLDIRSRDTKAVIEEKLRDRIGKPEMFNSDYRADPKPDRDPVEVGEYYYNLYQETGYLDWYHWCCNHWGVKWNACDCDFNGDTLYFDSPWGYPEPIYQKLCETFPDEQIKFRWFEEQGYWGELHNDSGFLVEDDEGFETWDWEDEDEPTG